MRELLTFRLCLLVFSGCVLLISGIYQLGREGVRAVKASPFSPHLGDYLRSPERLAPGRDRPLVKGAYLPINLNRRVVDELYLSLPASMRAERPEEVATVVWMRWGQADWPPPAGTDLSRHSDRPHLQPARRRNQLRRPAPVRSEPR
jgi:hypothetical protein